MTRRDFWKRVAAVAAVLPVLRCGDDEKQTPTPDVDRSEWRAVEERPQLTVNRLPAFTMTTTNRAVTWYDLTTNTTTNGDEA